MRFLPLIALLAAFAMPSRADVVYSNLPLGTTGAKSIGASSQSNAAPVRVATGFLSSGDYTLTTIRVPIVNGGPTNAFWIALLPDPPLSPPLEQRDANGIPANALEVWNPVAADCCDLTTVTSAGGIHLLAGVQYWVAVGAFPWVSNQNFTVGSWTESQMTGDVWTGSDNSLNWSPSFGFLPGLEVNGAPDVSAVPEPGSILLSGAALTALAALQLRRRHR